MLQRLLLFGALIGSLTSSTQADQPATRQVIESYDYQDVTLDGGPLRRQFEQVMKDYLRIPNDDLLKGFRQRAGITAPGRDLGGWYSLDRFLVFGQIVSGLSRMHAATGDMACKEKVDTLIAEWGRCIASDGFFYYSNTPNAQHYGYDKIVGGLVDAAHYCGNRDALAHLSRITDWAIKNLDRTNTYNMTGPFPATEWYTLSENLYRAYQLTGDVKYRDFARVWEYTDYWIAYADKKSIFDLAAGYHAYSHVNTLSGAAQAYIVRGEPHYLDTLRNAYDFLQQQQTFATGGYGPGERLMPVDQLRRTLDVGTNHFETQCGSWAAFKLSKYLITLTGEARFGDWIERLALNGIGASVDMTTQGETQYYSYYHLHGAVKGNNNGLWTCCTGTRPQAVADYHDLIYFKDRRGIYVNLFADSTARWSGDQGRLVLRQRSGFPETPRTELTIEAPRPIRCAIRVRMPAWLAEPASAKINGEAAPITVDAKGWAIFDREWKDGDRLEITLPMTFRACRFPESDPHAFPCAVMRGPVVLVFISPAGNPSRKIDYANLASNFVPIPDKPLNYHLAANPKILLRPYYALGANEPYFMYLNPAYTWTRLEPDRTKILAPWRKAGNMLICAKVGTSFEQEFEGSAVRWNFCLFNDAGRAEVSVDGGHTAKVDLYNPQRGPASSYTIKDLPPGRHVLRITILPGKNPASSNRFINITGFDVMNDRD